MTWPTFHSNTGRTSECVNESMNENIECVNLITDNVNNNFVNVIINESFGDQAIVDQGSFLSFVDYNFCKKHSLHVIPLQPGQSRS